MNLSSLVVNNKLADGDGIRQFRDMSQLVDHTRQELVSGNSTCAETVSARIFCCASWDLASSSSAVVRLKSVCHFKSAAFSALFRLSTVSTISSVYM